MNCEHRWSPTAVWDEGRLYAPCLEPLCHAELEQTISHRIVQGHGLELDGVELDILDDEAGGVAKVILREAFTRFGDGWPEIDSGVILDIGAHVGVVSIFLSKRYPRCKIVAFEPVPANFERLVRNLEVNQVSDHVTPVNLAVSATGAPVALSGMSEHNTGGFSAFTSSAPQCVAASTTLPEIMSTYAPEGCALLKMDCEGAEHDILRTSPDVLDRVLFFSGEFHINNRLAKQGHDIDVLTALVREHIPEDRVRVNACRIAE